VRESYGTIVQSAEITSLKKSQIAEESYRGDKAPPPEHTELQIMTEQLLPRNHNPIEY